MLFSEKNHLKAHKNQWLSNLLSPPDSSWGAMNQGTMKSNRLTRTLGQVVTMVVWLAWEYCHRLKGTVGVTEGEDNAVCNQEGNDDA